MVIQNVSQFISEEDHNHWPRGYINTVVPVPADMTLPYTLVYTHFNTTGHQFENKDGTILDTESNWSERGVKERTESPALNRHGSRAKISDHYMLVKCGYPKWVFRSVSNYKRNWQRSSTEQTTGMLLEFQRRSEGG